MQRNNRDKKYSGQADDVLRACGTEVLLTPPRQPVANCFAERFVRTARDELFHHVLVWGEHDLRRKLGELVGHYHERPHQGLGQRSPREVAGSVSRAPPAAPGRVLRFGGGRVRSEPVLGGLHHSYRLAS